MGKLVAIALLFAGCERKPEPPLYFYQRTVENADGSTLTLTWSGPKPPPWDEKE